MILKFILVISLACNKDTDIEALAPAFCFHHCLVLSCIARYICGIELLVMFSSVTETWTGVKINGCRMYRAYSAQYLVVKTVCSYYLSRFFYSERF